MNDTFQLGQPATPASPVLSPPPTRLTKRRMAMWAAALLLAGWLLPALVRLNYIQSAVASALSTNLGRPVRVGDIHPHLVSGWESGMGLGLGVEVENVEIADDPRFGAEPLARIEVVEARLAWRSIWHRQLEFSHVVLRNPSVNLVRGGAGDWNLLALPLGGDSSAAQVADAPVRLAQYPDVRIVDGRLNFKLDNRKKSFYLSGLDVDLRAPRAAGQPWQFEFSGTPSRTSFEQVPALVVRGEGQLGPFTSSVIEEAGVPLKFSWQARDALLGELAAALAGSDHGMHGTVNLTGEASGTSTLLRVAGRAAISDLHRWDVIPQRVSTEIPAEFSGMLDLREDVFQLTKFSLPLRVNNQPAGLIEIDGTIAQVSHSPSLHLDAEARGVPLTAVRALSEPFALNFDPLVGVSGVMNGRLRVQGAPAHWAGEASFDQVVLTRHTISPDDPGKFVETSRVRLGPVEVRLANGKYEAGPVDAQFSKGESLQFRLSGSLHDGSGKIALRASRAPLVEVLAWMPEAGVGQLGVEVGTIDLNLNVMLSGAAPPTYAGRATVTGARLRGSGLTAPMEITSARVQMKNRTAVLRPLTGRLHESAVRGATTVLLPGADRQQARELRAGASAVKVSFDLQADEVNLDRLAAAPAPEKQSWLAGLLNRPQAAPGAAGSEAATGVPLEAAGKVKVDRVVFRGVEITGMSAGVGWEGGEFRLKDFSAALAGGRLSGSLLIRPPGRTASAAASLNVSAAFRRVDVQQLADRLPEFASQYGGQLSGKIELHGSGASWEQVWKGLAGAGEVAGTNVVLAKWELPALPHLRPEMSAGQRVAQFTEASLKFEVAEQAISIVQFSGSPVAEASGVARGSRVSATGTIGFDKALQIAAANQPEGAQGATEFRWTGSVLSPQLEDAAALARNAVPVAR